MTHADPTPRSPADVLRDRSTYRLVESEMINAGFGGHFVRLTVTHYGTETLWQCEYPLHASMFAANWWPARRVEVKVVQYRRVP